MFRSSIHKQDWHLFEYSPFWKYQLAGNINNTAYDFYCSKWKHFPQNYYSIIIILLVVFSYFCCRIWLWYQYDYICIFELMNRFLYVLLLLYVFQNTEYNFTNWSPVCATVTSGLQIKNHQNSVLLTCKAGIASGLSAHSVSKHREDLHGCMKATQPHNITNWIWTDTGDV